MFDLRLTQISPIMTQPLNVRCRRQQWVSAKANNPAGRANPLYCLLLTATTCYLLPTCNLELFQAICMLSRTTQFRLETLFLQNNVMCINYSVQYFTLTIARWQFVARILSATSPTVQSAYCLAVKENFLSKNPSLSICIKVKNKNRSILLREGENHSTNP